jgi:polar amino acid transport system substrate-binding protein
MTDTFLRSGRWLAAALAATLTVTPAAADTLEDIIERGTLIAGAKPDYAPWGFRNPDGALAGLEIDMLNDFVRQLSEHAGKPIELELVPVVASNRMEFLEQGRIDMFIATMSDTEQRREVVGIVQPNYYSSGVSLFAKPETGITDWADIDGRKICGIQGAWYNREHGLKNGAEIVAFKGVPEVEQALLDGRCEGWLYDDSAFVSRKTLDPEKWAAFELVVPTVADVPWGAAVRLDDLGGPLSELLSEAIAGWHASGTLLELEKKWGIPETAWLRKMHEACKAGEPICDSVRAEGES